VQRGRERVAGTRKQMEQGSSNLLWWRRSLHGTRRGGRGREGGREDDGRWVMADGRESTGEQARYALFSFRMKFFFYVILNISEGYGKWFLETNKKNKLHSSSENCKTNLLNIINLLLAHVGYYST